MVAIALVRKELYKAREIQSDIHSFVAIRIDGFIVTWGGDGHYAGDTVKAVQQVQANIGACAANQSGGHYLGR